MFGQGGTEQIQHVDYTWEKREHGQGITGSHTSFWRFKIGFSELDSHKRVFIPSCLKSWATLLPLTGSESSMGVWITCRSPAPNVIVLYRLRDREGERKERLKVWCEKAREQMQLLRKISGLISCARPESSVSQRQRDGGSQKLSRYITNKTQAIQADRDMNGAGQDSMPTTLLQKQHQHHHVNEPLWEWEIPAHRCGRWQVSCAGHFPLQSNVRTKGKETDQGESGWIISLRPWSASWDNISVGTLSWSDMQSVFLREILWFALHRVYKNVLCYRKRNWKSALLQTEDRANKYWLVCGLDNKRIGELN